MRSVLVQLIKHFPLPLQVSFTFGADVVSKFLNRHDLDLICRAHQVLTLSDVSKVSSPSDYVHCPCLRTNALLQTLLIRLLHSSIIPGGNMDTNNIITQHNPSRLSKMVTSFSPKGSLSLCSLPPTTVESLITPGG